MDGLAPIDGWALAAILAKAVGYAASLLAMGGPLFLATFPAAPDDARRLARRIAVIAALVIVTILALRLGLRAGRISGMGLAGATDAMMLGLVWDSPLGTAALWRGGGAAVVLALLIDGRAALGLAVLGAALIALSYTFVGHALGEPGAVLSALLSVHLLSAAFWVGALGPLRRAAGHRRGAMLLHRFGVIAGGTVALLVVAGTTFAWLMVGSLDALVTTAYGWTLLAKLCVVAGLMGLAAVNKWRLVPALAEGRAGAAAHLRRTIGIEGAAVALILIATATLTTVTTPPVNL